MTAKKKCVSAGMLKELDRIMALDEYKFSIIKWTKEIVENLSEDFIRGYQNEIPAILWNKICTYKELSEDFIIEFQDKLNWYNISYFQNLSEEFIGEHQEKLNWVLVINNEKIPAELRRELYLEDPSRTNRYKFNTRTNDEGDPSWEIIGPYPEPEKPKGFWATLFGGGE